MANATVKQMKPLRLFVPLTRKDAATRTVEGYCYVNAEVGDGFNLTRKAMEKATDDYMKWGAVRAMHQPIAAGQAEAVVWDQKGALLRAKITDDAEWKKVEDGTYKGFSVGVLPEIVRGNKVEKAKWIENSLVDRPFDEDAGFTNVQRFVIARRDGVDVKDDSVFTQKFPVVILPAKIQRRGSDDIDVTDIDQFTQAAKDAADETDPVLQRIKMKKLRKKVQKIAKVKAALNAGNLYYGANPTLTRTEVTMPTPTNNQGTPANDTTDWRARALSAEQREQIAVARVQKLERKLMKKAAALERAEGELGVLRRMPANTPPVRFPNGAQRSYEANTFEVGQVPNFGEDFSMQGQGNVDAQVKRYRELVTADPAKFTENQRGQMAVEIGVLSTQLSDAGIDPTAIG